MIEISQGEKETQQSEKVPILIELPNENKDIEQQQYQGVQNPTFSVMESENVDISQEGEQDAP